MKTARECDDIRRDLLFYVETEQEPGMTCRPWMKSRTNCRTKECNRCG